MSGGGSVRLSFVPVDTALCVGPRNEVQSWVTAPAGSGLGFPTARACAPARPARSGCDISACNRTRREILGMPAHCNRAYTHAMKTLGWIAALAALALTQAAQTKAPAVKSLRLYVF